MAGNDPRAYRAAIDEIIKYNQFTTEFNYMQEVAARFIDRLMPETKRLQKPNWAALFDKYDVNKDRLIVKSEVGQMMRDAGMKHSTDAEIQYVFNVMSKWKPTCTVQTFINWGEMLQGRP